MPRGARHRGGHRRRRHRLRVRLDDVRPRHPGHRARGAAQDPARLRRGRDHGRRALVQEAGHRGAHRRQGHRPRARRRRHGGQRRGRRPHQDRRRGRLGRPPARHRRPRPRRHAGRRSTSAASSWSTSSAAPARTACAPSATASPRPQLAHVGFAEAIVAIEDILGEDAVPIDYGKVPWGIYCHPEVAFAGHSEQSAKEAGLDVVASKHRYSGQQPGHDRRRPGGPGEGHRREDARRHGGHDRRRAHGGPVGHRAARPGLPGRQLGGHGRRGRRLHPAAPDAVRAVRRDRAGPDRPPAARCTPTGSTTTRRPRPDGRHPDAPAR